MISKLFSTIAINSLVASFLITSIIGIKLVFKDKLSPKWHYFIWLLLLLKLAIPYGFESSLSIQNVIPITAVAQEYLETENSETIQENTNNSTLQSNSNSSKASSPVALSPVLINETNTNENISINSLLPGIWLAGTLLMFGFMLFSNNMLYIKTKRGKLIEIPMISELLEEVKEEFSVTRTIQVFASDKVHSPILIGLIRPRLLIPMKVLYALSEDELRYIFLHELAHYKQKDLIIKLFSNLLCCIYWFNPVVLFGIKRMNTDCEISCDANALNVITDDEHKDYGLTLIKVITSQKRHVFTTSLSFGNKKYIKRRLLMIANYKNSSIKWGVIGLSMALLLSATVLTTPLSIADNQAEIDKTSAPKIHKEFVKKESHMLTPASLQEPAIAESDLEQFDGIWPLKDYFRVSSSFGEHSPPSSKNAPRHSGMDIPAPMKTDIYSITDGEVIFSGMKGPYGKTMIIDHGDGYTSVYAHCSKLFLAKGDKVARGDVIAKVGNSGRSTGPHVHLEIRYDGAPQDPLGYLTLE